MTRPTASSRIEPLEARIAPALTLAHPLPDLVAGIGKTGATVDLSKMFDAAALHANRTVVQFTTNFDTDTNAAGLQPGIVQIELFDDLTPLTVQNFLSYVNNKIASGNYDDTFFHRSVTNFVLQGGGYESGGAHPHIPTPTPVHNEFDISRSNVRGTITMAKTDVSPHTATSEFFFNVHDNNTGTGDAGNLDLQNGGFTVFGTVIQGLDVIDKIVALPTRAVVGSAGAPVQNYNADPDSNPATPAPAPTRDQLIRITKAEVLPQTAGNAAGITFSVTTQSDLVSAIVSGQTLNLKYKPGAVGVAEVMVKATSGSDTFTDTFTVKVQPNLIAQFSSDGLPTFPVPGDTATVKFQIINNTGGLAKGSVDIRFSLAQEVVGGTGNPIPIIVPFVKTPVGSVLGKAISLASGSAISLSAKIQIPTDLVLDPTKTYRLIAEVTPAASLAANELFTDDNTALNGNRHEVFNRFGKVQPAIAIPARENVPLTLVQDGDRVTFSLTGGGTAELIRDAGGHIDLHLFNTTTKSKLSAKVVKGTGGDGRVKLNDIFFDDALGSAALGLFDADGFIAASGGIVSLALGHLTGPASLTLGALLANPATKAVITLGRVHDYSIESDMPIASLTALEWLDTTGAQGRVLTLGKLAVAGGFQGQLAIVGDAPLTSFTVGGAVKDSTVTAAGNVGAVSLGAIDGSRFFAGVTARPTALADFANARTIASFTIKGIAGVTTDLFQDSQIAAQTIGAITVKGVSGVGAADFGFVADVIKSYNRVGGVRLAKLTDPLKFTPPGQADKVGARYLVTIL